MRQRAGQVFNNLSIARAEIGRLQRGGPEHHL
jgi:hypothetical protein